MLFPVARRTRAICWQSPNSSGGVKVSSAVANTFLRDGPIGAQILRSTYIEMFPKRRDRAGEVNTTKLCCVRLVLVLFASDIKFRVSREDQAVERSLGVRGTVEPG